MLEIIAAIGTAVSSGAVFGKAVKGVIFAIKNR